MRIAGGVLLAIAAVACLIGGSIYFLSAEGFKGEENRLWQKFERENPTLAKVSGRNSELWQKHYAPGAKDFEATGVQVRLVGFLLLGSFILSLIGSIFLFMNRYKLYVYVTSVLLTVASLFWVVMVLKLGGTLMLLGVLGAGYCCTAGLLAFVGARRIQMVGKQEA